LRALSLGTIAENRGVCGICASERNVRYAPTCFGAQGSLTFDANRWFGVTVDAGGQYRRNDLRTEWLHAYELMGGPQLRIDLQMWTCLRTPCPDWFMSWPEAPRKVFRAPALC
jgi:hypothetical protein